MGTTSRSNRFGTTSTSLTAVGAVAIVVGSLATQRVSAADESVIAEVIVTAQKRAESIQNVPMSIQALSGDDLQHAGFVDLADYARFATNVSIVPQGSGNKNGTTMNMRGISPLTGAPTVGFYIDDTPASSPLRAGTIDPRLYDIDRVEVLKGPQGHLYGASAMGGVIRLITRQPKFNKFEAGFDVSASLTAFADKENLYFDGVVNIPLVTDKAALRVTASLADEGGYVGYVSPFAYGPPNTANPGPPAISPVPIPDIKVTTDKGINSSKLLSLRANLRYAPTDWLTLTPTVFYQRRTANGIDAVYQDTFGYSTPRASPYVPEGVETEFMLSSLTAEANAGAGVITSTTSYLDVDGNSADDLTQIVTQIASNSLPTAETAALISPIFNRSILRQFTQEVRFASSWEFPVSAVAGLFYENNDNDARQSMYFKQGAGALLGFTTDLLFVKTQPAHYGEKSAFGNLSYKFFAERFEIQAGGRYSEMDLGFKRFGDGILNGGVSTTDFAHKEHVTSISLSASAHISDNNVVYVRYAEGYRPGFDTAPPPEVVCGVTPFSGGVVLPDNTKNYEIGAKTLWHDGRVLFNATVFKIDYADVQQAILLPQCGYTVFANAGSATSKGFETEFGVKLLSGALDLRGGVGYVDSTLDQAAPPVGADPGESLVNVPNWTGSVSAEYRKLLPWWTDREGYVRGDYRYVGKRNGDFGGVGTPPNPLFVAAAYDLLDLRLGVNSNGWDFSLFVSNLFDKRAQLGYENLGPRITYINRPRTIGLAFRKEL
jgi:outer membrane receptor protein involved in Fe transport